MDEDKEFFKDMREGLIKAGQVLKYLLETLTFYAGREEEKRKRESSETKLALSSKGEDMRKKHIYHRKDGRWEYSYTKDGSKVYLIASTKEKLIEKIQDTKKEFRRVKKEDTSFADWVDKWLKLYKVGNLAEGTLKRYQQLIKKHIKPFFKNIPIRKLTTEKVQQFVNQIPTERNREYAYTTIKQILRFAFINKKISDNISESIVKPRRKTRTIKTGLSLEKQIAFMKILKTYEPDVQMFMLFSILLGTRRSETLAFKFEDLNKIKNTVHIKGTKTYASDRKIKISNDFIDLLEKNKTAADNEPYFKYVLDNYSKKAKDIYQKAGIKNKTLHDLRHTCSTNLYYLGVPDKQRQQILGHASILMTNDIYTNLQEDLDKDGLLKLYNNLYYKF